MTAKTPRRLRFINITWTWAQHKKWRLRTLAQQKQFGHTVFLGGTDFRTVAGDLIAAPAAGIAVKDTQGYGINMLNPDGHPNGTGIRFVEQSRELVPVGKKVALFAAIVECGAKYIHVHGVIDGVRVTWRKALAENKRRRAAARKLAKKSR